MLDFVSVVIGAVCVGVPFGFFVVEKLTAKLSEALGGIENLDDPKRLAEGQRRLGEYVA
jgi:hypothetical protein